jgi:hypothetical protein
MNAEAALITAIVETGDLAPLMEAKVTKEFFDNPEDREVFEYIMRHWARYGKVPGEKAILTLYPDYEFEDGDEPFEFYLDEVRGQHKFKILYEVLNEAAEVLEDREDTDSAVDLIAGGLTRIYTEVSELRDTNIIETWESRLETYSEWRLRGDALKGIPSGFPTVDNVLRGFQAEQLITFVGTPKAGKSWMMLAMAIAAHNYGKTPLFIGFEMSNEEQEARYDAIVGGINYSHLLKGQTTAEEDDRLFKALRRRKNGHPLVMSSDPDGSTVSRVAAKIEQYKPDIVFIDGVYMMDDEEGEPKGSPQALTNITRSLKKLARRTSTPIVISTQVLLWKLNKKRGLDENAIGYTSSFIHDSDVGIGVETPGDDPNSPMKLLKVLLARTAPRFEVGLFWNWDFTTFEEIRYDEDDDIGYGEADDEDETPARKKKLKKRRRVMSRVPG